jgi:N-dimethylarginine dimethylaminohydrolase
MARAMQELLTIAPQGANVDWYKEKLEEWFYDNVKAESIAADVKSLQQTYEKVIEIGGTWPAKKYR